LGGLRLQTNLFLFQRSMLFELEGFDERLSTLEDYDLFLRASHGFPIGYVDQVLCHIYAHADSLGTGISKRKGYYNRWLLHRKLLRRFPAETASNKGFWRLQADLYRNLAVMMLSRNCFQRAHVFFCASLRYWKWQPGMMRLAVRLYWRGR